MSDQLIQSDTEYKTAVEKLNALELSHPSPDSEEADEIDLLAYLIACYERHRME